MLVELYEKDGYWFFKDNYNVEWGTSMPVDPGTSGNRKIEPLEALIMDDTKAKLKMVTKLKKEGFTTEEIVELFENKVL